MPRTIDPTEYPPVPAPNKDSIVFRETRFQSLLSRLLDPGGRDISLERISELLLPTFNVNDTEPDLYYARGEKLFQFRVTSSAAVGNLSQVRITPAPGFLVVIQGLRVKSTVAQIIAGDLAYGTVDAGTINTTRSACDARVQTDFPTGAGLSPILYGLTNSVGTALSTVMFEEDIGANAYETVDLQPIILVPGSEMRIQGGVANADVTTLIRGFGRPVDYREARP